MAKQIFVSSRRHLACGDCSDAPIMNKHPTNINPPKKDSSREEVVITPAGPVSKDQVHPVGPGETIQRNPDGTYSVIREKDQEDKEKEGENG
jgi:hypothetical protein